MSAVGWGGRRRGRGRRESTEQVRERIAYVVPREPDVGCFCLCTCLPLCERSRGMSFICAWHRFGAQVRSVLGLLG